VGFRPSRMEPSLGGFDITVRIPGPKPRVKPRILASALTKDQVNAQNECLKLGQTNSISGRDPSVFREYDALR
jgi:hypothetical protein